MEFDLGLLVSISPLKCVLSDWDLLRFLFKGLESLWIGLTASPRGHYGIMMLAVCNMIFIAVTGDS